MMGSPRLAVIIGRDVAAGFRGNDLKMLMAIAVLLATAPSAAPDVGETPPLEQPKPRSRFRPLMCVGSATSARIKISAGWRDTATTSLELRPDRTIDWSRTDVSWASGPGDDTAGASFDYGPAGAEAWNPKPRSFGVSIVAPRDVIAGSRLRIVADGAAIFDGPTAPPVGLNLAGVDFERGADTAGVIDRAHNADHLQLTLYNQAGAKLTEAAFMTGAKDRRDVLLHQSMKRAIDASRGVASDQAFCR